MTVLPYSFISDNFWSRWAATWRATWGARCRAKWRATWGSRWRATWRATWGQKCKVGYSFVLSLRICLVLFYFFQWISCKNTDFFLNADAPLPRRLQTDFEAAIDPGQLTIELHETLRSISARAVNICCPIPKFSGFKSLNITTSFNLCARRNKCWNESLVSWIGRRIVLCWRV